ncbi:MAG: ABC transporter substrate-binding protein, partial [Mesorhizobium sp.]
LADIKAFLAKTGGKCAIACDANDSPNARPVVEAVHDAGAYISTIWNKTDDLHPWDVGDNYVSHMTWSDEKPAEQTARILFDAMGGKGGVVH